MAEKETPKAAEEKPAAPAKQTAEEKEAERAEKQWRLAQRLTFGPIRDPE